MKRKYLDELGICESNRWDGWNKDDPRQSAWENEREEYGFDERETWALDAAFYQWLYERLRMYVDICCVDLDYHHFEYKGETLTQRQCIDRMLRGLEIALTKADYKWTEEDEEKIAEIAEIWALVLPAMWW